MMKQAQLLGWTQNTVILECCETNNQRAFYIGLAAKQNLSKLALVNAIESGTFETASDSQTHSEDLGVAYPTVGDDTTTEAVDTTSPTEKPCGAFVTACEPLRQGSGLHIIQFIVFAKRLKIGKTSKTATMIFTSLRLFL